MKPVVKLLTLVFVLTATASFASSVAPAPAAKSVATTVSNEFAFKVDRAFKKALIEIYSEGDLVAVTALSKRKMTINFADVKSGTYTIKIKKNNRVEVFQFVKK